MTRPLARLVAATGLALAALAAPLAHAADAANGKLLYNTRYGAPNQGCYSCHGIQGSTLVNTNKIRNGVNNPTLIQTAINNDTGGMLYLKPFLNSSQIADIAAYLGNPGLVGLGTPTAGVSPASLAFASTNVGSASAAQTVTLSNTGTGALTLSTIAVDTTTFRVTGGTCTAGGSVSAGGSCTATVTFNPTAGGAASGTLTFTHNASPTTSTVALSGTGVATSPVASLGPATLSFSQVVGTTSSAQSVTLANTGNAALVVSSVSIVGAQSGDYATAAGTTCTAGSSIAAGSSCVVAVAFTPAASGARNATLAIAHNAAGGSSTATLAGTGTLTPQPVMSLNSNALAFASQTVGSSSAAQSVTLTNSGQASMTLASVALSGANAGDYALGGSCVAGATVAAGASCTVGVTFAPTVVGTRSASVAITSNASNPSATIGLSGTAVAAPAPALTLAPAAVAFGNVTVGTAALARSVTLTNGGNATLNLAGIAVSGTGYSATHGCGASLAAGASCTVTLGFTPASAAAASGQLTITSNAAGSPHAVALSGTGTLAALPVLAWSGATDGTFANDIAVGSQSMARSFSLVNQGPGSVTLASIAAQGAGAADFTLGGNCTAGVALAAGASCSVSVVFGPSQAGARAATLDVASSGTSPPSIALAGNGTSTAQSALSISSTMLAFPPVPAGATQQTASIVVANSGTAGVTITGFTFTSSAFSAVPAAGGGCSPLPATLAPGQQCSVDVTLDLASPGSRTATMTVVTSGGASVPPLEVRADLAAAGAIVAGNLGAGGCSIAGPDRPFDPVLPMLLVLAAAVALWRARRTAPVSMKENSR